MPPSSQAWEKTEFSLVTFELFKQNSEEQCKPCRKPPGVPVTQVLAVSLSALEQGQWERDLPALHQSGSTEAESPG